MSFINELSKRIVLKVALVATEPRLGELRAFHDRLPSETKEDFYAGRLESGSFVSFLFLPSLGTIRGFTIALQLVGSTATSEADLATLGRGADAAILLDADPSLLARLELRDEAPVLRSRGEPLPALLKEATKRVLTLLKQGGSGPSSPAAGPRPSPDDPMPGHYPVDVGPYRFQIPDLCPNVRAVDKPPLHRLEGFHINGVGFEFIAVLGQGTPDNLRRQHDSVVASWGGTASPCEVYIEGLRFAGTSLSGRPEEPRGAEHVFALFGPDLIMLTVAYFGRDPDPDDRVRRLCLAKTKTALLRRMSKSPELFRQGPA